MNTPLILDETGHNMQIVNVTSRVSRLSYGITKFVDFEPGRHLEADRFYHHHTGREIAKDQMHWYLQQVNNIPTRFLTHPVRVLIKTNRMPT
jgi:hypothetical protein